MAPDARIKFCSAKKGGVRNSKPCECEALASELHDVHRCSCGGQWDNEGRVVRPPAYPAIVGWGQDGRSR